MDKRTLVEKRMRYPIFKFYGMVTPDSIYTLSKLYKNTKESLSNALHLRDTQVSPEFRVGEDLGNYSQYDIQTRSPESIDTEENYNITPEDFIKVKDEVSYMLQSPVCRMRYSKILKNDILDYHIDQPGKDRFIMVIEGEHIMHIKTRKGNFQQLMLPGEVWYINSNWEHKVENIGKQERLALLGCFEYNNN